MSRKHFTAEEIKILCNNRYTLKVTEAQISFTKEFKEQFWLYYCNGMTSKQILSKCGYNPDMFGKSRIKGLRGMILKEMKERDCFQHTANPGVMNSAKELKQLQHEVKYLRQEVEFLKKISSIKTTKKQEDS